MARILAISGSFRADSFNRRLLHLAMDIAKSAGAEASELDLKALDIPHYDGDIEAAGLPPSVQELKRRIEESDIVMIASPEYNYSIPGGLKNAIDWASRAGNSFKGKFGIIMGVSNGKFGTIRMQPDLRKVLGGLHVTLLPQPQVHVSMGAEAFTPEGKLADMKTAENLEALIKGTLELFSRTHAS